MRHLREPSVNLFWDTNIWTCLFELGNESDSEREIEHRKLIKTYSASIEIGSAGIVFSPCILADLAKNVVLEQFKAKLKPFEDAGYVTIPDATADWNGLAALRSGIRRDVREHPLDFAHIERPNISLGDTAVIYAAIKTGCDELWTYDGFMLACSGRRSVRGLTIIEPHPLQLQGVLELE